MRGVEESVAGYFLEKMKAGPPLGDLFPGGVARTADGYFRIPWEADLSEGQANEVIDRAFVGELALVLP